MYSQDFAPAEAVYAPSSDGLMLGLPPLLIAGLLILLLAAGALGWWIGRRPGKTADSAAQAIWKKVDGAIRTAMTAHSEVLADRAEALRRTVQDQLGKTLALAGGLAALKDLNDALGHGTPDDHAGDHDEHEGHGHASTPHEGDDHHDEASQPAASGVHIERADKVVIHNPPRPNPPPHSPKPPKPAQTEAERRDAIRKAISALNDHWRLKEARIAEIEAAHAELSGRRV